MYVETSVDASLETSVDGYRPVCGYRYMTSLDASLDTSVDAHVETSVDASLDE